MAVSRFVLALASCLALARCVHGFSSGGPDSVCDSLMPNHGADPKQTSSPYQITTTLTNVVPGQIIEVTLSGNPDFRGYFIRGMQKNAFIGGTFQQSNSGLLKCNGQGMTHSDGDLKSSVTITWKAPDDLDSSPINFVATVVQDRATFWVSVKSGSIDVARSPSDVVATSPSETVATVPNGAVTTSPNFTVATAPNDPGETFPNNPGTSFPSDTSSPNNPGESFPNNPGASFPNNPGSSFPNNPGSSFPSNPGSSFQSDTASQPQTTTISPTGSATTNQENSTRSFSDNTDSSPPFGQPVSDTTTTTQTVTNVVPGAGSLGQPVSDTTTTTQTVTNFVPGAGSLGQPVSDTTTTTQTVTNVVPGAGSLGQSGTADNSGNSFQNAESVVVDSACGKSKGCYHNCQTRDFCSYLISWSYQKDTVQFHFLYKTPSITDQWIALALSRDTLMGDDSVMECVMEKGKVYVKISYNNGKLNEYTGDKFAGLSEMEGSVENGVMACSFRRKVTYTKEPRVFDLSLPYHLMVATGEYVSGNKLPHSYEKLPKVSAEKISLQQVVDVSHGLDPFYPMVKTHGTLMTLAWLFFASCGLFIARHGKSMFNNAKPLGIHVWFHIHRFCMGMTALLTTLGFILILVESQGYSFIPEAPGKSYRTLHPPLGLILVVLTLVNPLMALFRPDAKAPSRPLFKWSHWGLGICAWGISFLMVLIGLDLSKSQADVEAMFVVFAFIGYQIVIDIITRMTPSVLASLYERFGQCCGHNNNSYDISMAEVPTNEVPRSETGNAAISNKELTTQEAETLLRHKNVITSTILVIHMLISACFAIAVLYFFLRRPAGSRTSASV